MIKTILLVLLCVQLPLVQLQAMIAQEQIPNKQHRICKWISKSNGRYCGQEYDTATTLQEHVLETHMIRIHVPSDKSKNNRSKYVCKWKNCKRKQIPFSGKARFERHIRTHSGEKPFLCNKCEKSFIQNENLQQHLRTHSSKKPFSCNQCGMSFKKKAYLIQHYKTIKHKMNDAIAKVDDVASEEGFTEKDDFDEMETFIEEIFKNYDEIDYDEVLIE